MSSIDLSIIVVSFNTQKYTLECLESVYRETDHINFEVILIDNASSDNTVQLVKANFPQVKLITSIHNHGFAKGNNIAAKEANGEYLLLLNPDTIVQNRAIEKLLAFAQENPGAGVYGGRTIFPDGSLNRSCYSKSTLWSLICSVFGLTKIFPFSSFLNPVVFGSWKYNTIRNVDIISGCFLLIKKEIWDKLNGFNPLFFMYAEEVDLCLRAKQLGCDPLFYPEAEIIHYRGASESNRADKLIKTYRGEVTIIYEYWPKYKIFLGIKLYLLKVWLKSFYYNIFRFINTIKFSEPALEWEKIWRNRKIWVKGWYSNVNNTSNKKVDAK
jgi:N-acetylglucosaminyl-diphospho-decaprenol L-rhamnosyltransferase